MPSTILPIQWIIELWLTPSPIIESMSFSRYKMKFNYFQAQKDTYKAQLKRKIAIKRNYS